MAETYTEMLRRALGNTAGPTGFLLNENTALLDLFRRMRPGATRPPESPVTEPVAPAVSENPPSSFQQAQAARRPAVQPAARPAAEETPETFEAMRQFQAGLRNQQMQGTGGSGQLSVLDMLRKRMARDMEGEALQRVGEFGAGMLASGSPNFFTMLGAGARAAREGDVSRMTQLRQLAELERQDAAQRAEEAYRREQTRIQSERYAAEAPLRAAQARQAEAMAAFYTGRGNAPTVTPTLRLRAEGQVLTEARTLFPDPPRDALNREALVAQVEQQRRNYIAQRLPGLLESLGTPGQVTTPSAAGGGAGQPAPAAVLDLSGRPIR